MTILEAGFDLLWEQAVLPLLGLFDTGLFLLVSPMKGFPPLFQIAVLASLAAFLSRRLDRLFPEGREKADFETAMEDLASVPKDGSKGLQAAVRNEMRRRADTAYESLLTDRFFALGVTVLLPMFTVLIWIETRLFPEARLVALTGSPHAIPLSGGNGIPAGTTFVLLFNLILLAVWMGNRLRR